MKMATLPGGAEDTTSFELGPTGRGSLLIMQWRDSIGNFRLLLQSSQPLLTHRAFAGCSWLPRSILASCSASSAEQGNNRNSSNSGGPCSKTDRRKYTQPEEQDRAAVEVRWRRRIFSLSLQPCTRRVFLWKLVSHGGLDFPTLYLAPFEISVLGARITAWEETKQLLTSPVASAP
ncbi:uncharacterized protein O3Q21_010906 [Podargus strigoides]